MRKFSLICISLTIVVLFAASAMAQGPTKHYEKDGLSFDYPSNWTIQDQSDTTKQYIVVVPGNADLQVSVYAHREVFDSPEKIEEGRTKLVEPTVATYNKQMNDMGMKPTRKEDKSTVGGAPADAIHVRASLDGADGEAGIYWNVLNNRLVVFSVFGPDQAVKPLQKQINSLRESIAIAGSATPKPATAAKP